MNNSKIVFDTQIPADFNNKFKEVFPFYDYTSLLLAMKLWISTAKPLYKERAYSSTAKKVARVMNVIDILLARIINDEYYDDSAKVIVDKYQFGFCNDNPSLKNKLSKRLYDTAEKRKKYDIEYLFNLFKKYLLNMWD